MRFAVFFLASVLALSCDDSGTPLKDPGENHVVSTPSCSANGPMSSEEQDCEPGGVSVLTTVEYLSNDDPEDDIDFQIAGFDDEDGQIVFTYVGPVFPVGTKETLDLADDGLTYPRSLAYGFPDEIVWWAAEGTVELSRPSNDIFMVEFDNEMKFNVGNRSAAPVDSFRIKGAIAAEFVELACATEDDGIDTNFETPECREFASSHGVP